jgi:DNA-binding CsgD family transcriptional regulator
MSVAVVGRSAELAAIDAFLAAAENGAAALVFEGDPGIGKTTLWQAAVERAAESGARVLSSRPGPSEARLTFVGLGDLLAGLEPDLFERLPSPQRRALDVALLRTDPEGPSPERRVVATAFLSVLRELAVAAPVVVAVDDLQWLDTPTWHVVEFAARRLRAERVGVLAAARPQGAARIRAFHDDSLRRIRLEGLSLSALHRILKIQLGRSFARPILVRIERAASGNPYFALELGHAILESGDDLAGSKPLPLPDDLVQLLERRLRRLPAASRSALLAASALSQPTLGLLDGDGIVLAEEAGVVRVDERGRVAFAHPLLASVVYGSAPIGRRRRVHAALAKLVEDPEERARHLALAAESPDEQVAETLVAAARAARARGAPNSAIELLELASTLTPGELDGTRQARLFELAQCLAAAGDRQRAADVLRDLVTQAPTGPLRARARVILAFLLEWEGTEDAVGLCEQALLDAGGDLDLSAEIHAVTSRICDFDTKRKVAHARAALALIERRETSPRLHAYVLLAVAEAEFQAGHGIPHELFERAAALESAAVSSPEEPLLGALHGHSGLPLSTRLLALCLFDSDDLDEARRFFEYERRIVDEEGDEVQAARTLWRLAYVELRAGRWLLAEAHLRELASVVERTGQEGIGCKALTIAARLEALLGRVATARSTGERALALALEGGDEWLVAESVSALGFVELTAGNLQEARAQLARADEAGKRIGFGEPGLLRYHADHIETLLALGELEHADAVLESFEQQAATSGGAWARAAAGRSRGLVLAARGLLDDAVATLEQAVADHASLPIPFELARTLLVKGQVHRRRNERRLGREALLESIAIFEQLGSPLWGEKARAELRRLGVRKGASHELTPSEEHVASLAASGLTNREIAERLFVSPKTVEANLARAYRKLGIRSRAELGAHMAAREHLTKT